MTMQAQQLLPETQTPFTGIITGDYAFEMPKPRKVSHEVKINLFLEWISTGSSNVWYCSVCRFFEFSFDSAGWEIRVNGSQKEAGFFPEYFNISDKKRFVQLQAIKFFNSLNQ